MVLCKEHDGVYYINVYSQGETQLGRDLSNFADTPFEHPKYGKFKSVESLWVWAKTGRIHDRLKMMSARQVKKEGNKLFPRHLVEKNYELPIEFKELIKEGIRCKLKQNQSILWALISNNLPLKHYYVVNGNVKSQHQHDWVLDEIERIRTLTQDWYIKKYGSLPNIPIKKIDLK